MTNHMKLNTLLNLKSIMFIAVICGFSGFAAANVPASRRIDIAISPDVTTQKAAKQAHRDEPLRMAPTCGSSCRGGKGVRIAPNCTGPKCTPEGQTTLS